MNHLHAAGAPRLSDARHGSDFASGPLALYPIEQTRRVTVLSSQGARH